MESNEPIKTFEFPQFTGPSVSIIGIGGGAGRIVDKMQTCELPNIDLCAFGMNRKEMSELALAHKYLIGTDGLGSGKNRELAKDECNKALPHLERELSNKKTSFFVVCLGGGTGEGCIKTFLKKAVELQVVRLVIATLPHTSEGMEKRRNAIMLLGGLQKLADGILMVDYDDLPCKTITGLFEEADKKVIDTVNSFANLFVRQSRICFDWYDIRSFLGYHSYTKFVEYFTLLGNIDYLKTELKDIRKFLPFKYLSLDDVSNLLFAIYYNRETDDDTVRNLLDVVHDCIIIKLKRAELKWTIYEVSTMPVGIFRIDLFTKCN